MSSVTAPENSSGSFAFPTASQPDIIRANQKDVYYQGYILEHLETMVQSILGSRWLHSHQAFLKSISDALYLSLTTAIGNRTLGEEYTDIYQISSSSKQKPSTLRRWGYLITETAGWYILIHRWWPQARRRLERKQDEARETGKNGYREKLIRATLAIIENTSSVHLALFYFLGTYYSLPKRLFGIRYMFTRRLFPGEQRPGYELLGLLLLLQIITQSYLSLTSLQEDSSDPTASLLTSILSPNSTPHESTNEKATPTGARKISAIAHLPHAKISPPFTTRQNSLGDEVIDLADETRMPFIPTGSRKCPLCLDPMKDPTASECGHFFCWTCILRWTGESVGQGECPICRGKCGREGLLRLSG